MIETENKNLISLKQASEISGYSTVHLRHLVSTGKLWGIKIARNWVTSTEAIVNYQKQIHNPGRPGKN